MKSTKRFARDASFLPFAGYICYLSPIGFKGNRWEYVFCFPWGPQKKANGSLAGRFLGFAQRKARCIGIRGAAPPRGGAEGGGDGSATISGLRVKTVLGSHFGW